MRYGKRTWLGGGLALIALVLAAMPAVRASRLGGPFGHVEVSRPAGAPAGLVVLYGDTPDAAALARQLAQRGMLVARIDVERYLRKHRDMPGGQCALLDNQVEHLADRMLRREGIDQYLQPMLVGTGHGAGLVRQVLDSADPDVLAGAIVDDATAPAQLPQCASGTPDGHHGFLIAAGNASTSLALAADAHLPRQRSGALPGLPLVEMPAPGSRRLAILMSGDGGWHYLDKGVASQLHHAGVSVLGWNSLRYFWAPKTPEQAAADLARVITTYCADWDADEVALIGYSFGADAMPFLYRRLPPDVRRHVRIIVLMGTAHTADFQVRVGGWFGMKNPDAALTLPVISKLPPDRLLCVYGEKEKDTICPSLRNQGIDVMSTPGGHHFDHDPAKLAGRILARWQAAPPAGG